MWLRSGANPFLCRELRRLAQEADFVDVEATTKAFSYGTQPPLRAFALGRSSESSDAEYVSEVVEVGLATEAQMGEMANAWSARGDSAAAYAAFTWCRVIGRRP